MSRFIETIRFENGKPCRLELHKQRVVSTYMNFYGRHPGWDLTAILVSHHVPALGVHKCRITYNELPTSIEFEPYTISSIQTLKLVDGPRIDYRYKYADREPLNRLFDKRGSADDILIVAEGNITDTSYGNIVLMTDDGRWYTPSSCLLNGTMRQWLLESGRIFERFIGVNDLRLYRSFRVINALRGWDTTPSKVSDID